jgi:saccharopine dehydrogenase-like NADP-dependent oxidoreductase
VTDGVDANAVSVGCGFAGVAWVKNLASNRDLAVTLPDRDAAMADRAAIPVGAST